MLINVSIEDEQPLETLKGVAALVGGIGDTNEESSHLFTTQALRIVEATLYEVIKRFEEENKEEK